MNMRTPLIVSALIIGLAAGVRAQGSDEQAVRRVVTGFSAALAAGDSSRALSYLAPDVTILETGNVEDLDHYRNGHLRGDMAFASAVARERGPMTVIIEGDVAWATSTSVASGTYRDREINSTTAELMVLSRTPNGWTIRAIHWSSRRRS